MTRTSRNQGILQATGFVNIDNINSAGTWSLGLLQMDFFYRKKPWYAGQFVRRIVPRLNIPNESTPFFTTILNLQKKTLLSVLVRNVDSTFKNISVSLPVTCTGEIDFDFMSLVTRELEHERLNKLNAYLEALCLDNCELTDSERLALDTFENLEWREKSAIDLFTIKNTHSILASDIVPGSGPTPYLCASAEDNSVSSFISYNEDCLEQGRCVFIGGKTFVVTCQEQDFVSNDSHNLALYPKDCTPGREDLLFMVTCVNKSLGHKYYWGESISKEKITNDSITIPVSFDSSARKVFIRAVQKLVVREIANYVSSRIATT